MAASVGTLRRELMQSLGIRLQQKSEQPKSIPAGSTSQELPYRDHIQRSAHTRTRATTYAKQSWKRRRRSSGVSHDMAVQLRHTLRVERQAHLQQHQGEKAASNSLYDQMLDAKYYRPNSAKSRASDNSRGRLSSASSNRRSHYDCTNIGGAGSGNSKDMEVMLEICRSQGRGSSLNPADFDSSISAIANLPVAPFVGAASQGWGHYFNGSGTKKPQRRSSDAGATQQIRQRNKRARPPGKRSALSVATGTGGRGLKRPPEWRARSTGQQRLPPPLPPETMEAKVCRSRNAPPECTKVDNGGRFGRRTHSTGNDHCGRRRKKSIDGLADSRARAAIRAAEEEITQRLAVRLQILWDELKVPKPDRAYIVAMYLRQGEGVENEGWPKDTGSSSADMVEQQRSVGEIHHELVRQISLLLEHRAATIEALRSVRVREARLALVEESFRSFQWHRGRDTDAIGLVDALAGLREASLDVIHAVMEWRKNLWQPRAFCWRGVNYLEKMSRDANFLRSPAGNNLLASVGLAAVDMTPILFPFVGGDGRAVDRKACEDEARDSVGNARNSRRQGPRATGLDDEGVQPPPTLVRLTPKAELALEYRARFFGDDIPARAAGAGGGARGQNVTDDLPEESDEGTLRTTVTGAATHGKDHAWAVRLLLYEAELQRGVDGERCRLAAKGCFVPLLRWLPTNETPQGTHKARRRMSSPPGDLPSTPPLPGKGATSGEMSSRRDPVTVCSSRVGDGDATMNVEVETKDREATNSAPPAVAESNRQNNSDTGQVPPSSLPTASPRLPQTALRGKMGTAGAEEGLTAATFIAEGGGADGSEYARHHFHPDVPQPIGAGGSSLSGEERVIGGDPHGAVADDGNERREKGGGTQEGRGERKYRDGDNGSEYHGDRGNGNGGRRCQDGQLAPGEPSDGAVAARHGPAHVSPFDCGVRMGKYPTSKSDDTEKAEESLPSAKENDGESKAEEGHDAVGIKAKLHVGNQHVADLSHAGSPPTDKAQTRSEEGKDTCDTPTGDSDCVGVRTGEMPEHSSDSRRDLQADEGQSVKESQSVHGSTVKGARSTWDGEDNGDHSDIVFHEFKMVGNDKTGDEIECHGSSIAPSLLYDDDFEDDGENHSLSTSEGDSTEGSRSGVFGMKDNEDDDEGDSDNYCKAPDICSEGSMRINDCALPIQRAWRRKREVKTAKGELQAEDCKHPGEIEETVGAGQASESRTILQRAADHEAPTSGADENIDEPTTSLQHFLGEWRAKREPLVRGTAESDRAAARIQSIVRAKHAAIEVKKLRRQHEARRTARAKVIQARARGQAARRKLRREVEVDPRRARRVKEDGAVRRIQSTIRARYASNQEQKRRLHHLALVERATVKIQALTRGRTTRRRRKEISEPARGVVDRAILQTVRAGETVGEDGRSLTSTYMATPGSTNTEGRSLDTDNESEALTPEALTVSCLHITTGGNEKDAPDSNSSGYPAHPEEDVLAPRASARFQEATLRDSLYSIGTSTGTESSASPASRSSSGLPSPQKAEDSASLDPVGHRSRRQQGAEEASAGCDQAPGAPEELRKVPVDRVEARPLLIEAAVGRIGLPAVGHERSESLRLRQDVTPTRAGGEGKLNASRIDSESDDARGDDGTADSPAAGLTPFSPSLADGENLDAASGASKSPEKELKDGYGSTHGGVGGVSFTLSLSPDGHDLDDGHDDDDETMVNGVAILTNSDTIALASVPEGRSLAETTTPSEYGSDDLEFSAPLLSGQDGEFGQNMRSPSAPLAGKEGHTSTSAGFAFNVAHAHTDGIVPAAPEARVPGDARESKAEKGASDDSGDFLMSLSLSSSD